MTNSIHTKKYQQFVKRLKDARLEVGLKQIDVAKKFKKPQSYVSKVEAGEQRVDVIELKMFAKLYHKSPNYFLD